MYYHRHAYTDHTLIVSYIRTSLSEKKFPFFFKCLPDLKAYKIELNQKFCYREHDVDLRIVDFLRLEQVIYFNVIIRGSLSLTQRLSKNTSYDWSDDLTTHTHTHTHTHTQSYT
jgi:sulfite reductase beta subunit-like hemoprotein